MTRVTKTTFDRKCARGEWECEYEPTERSGYAQVRSTATNKRFMVEVR